jgi:predicted metal-dependent HD superfamily phosphohydrolase
MTLFREWKSLVRPEHEEWTWRMLEALYQPGKRRYHTLNHIEDCIACLNEHFASCTSPTEMAIAKLALFFHDAVYVPGQPDNEYLSAKFLEGLAGALTFDRDEVLQACTAILATSHKTHSYNRIDQIVVDCDLSILGSFAGYDAYARNVRNEFKHVSEDAWRIGRSNFLQGMLERKQIFLTSRLAFLDQYARRNMQAELEGLTRSPAP